MRLPHLPERPVVVEIGTAMGLLETLAALGPEAAMSASDPHGSTRSNAGAELRAELFTAAATPRRVAAAHGRQPARARAPVEPAGLPLQGPVPSPPRLARLATLAYFEVLHRPGDRDQAHRGFGLRASIPSSRPGRSPACSAEPQPSSSRSGTAMANEVILRLRSPGTWPRPLASREIAEFRDNGGGYAATDRRPGDELHRLGKRIAVWGGTGKSAAFICRYGLDRDRFPGRRRS